LLRVSRARNQAGAIRYLRLRKDVVQVQPDGTLADAKLVRDLFVRLAGRDQICDFPFTLGEFRFPASQRTKK
jgi:hypothetical protein